MNIYEKLQNIRVKLQEMNIKQTGNNKFAGYKYYELGDFLPSLNKLMLEHKLFSNISFGDTAVLTITNAENPEEKETFISPLSTATLKGCHEVQNLGAVQTYLKRYLYINAFEISEHDTLDSTTMKKTDDKINEAQLKRFHALAKGKIEKAKEICTKYGYDSSKDILKKDYEKICKEVEQLEI